MKISKETLSILEACSRVNEGIVIQPGSTIRTISVAGETTIRADVEEEFPNEFALVSVGTFVNAIKLFTDPDLEFEGNYVIISSNGSSCKYFSNDPDFVPHIKEDFVVPDSDKIIEFDLTKDERETISKFAKTLQIDQISIINLDGKLVLRISDESKAVDHMYDKKVGVCDKDSKISLLMNSDSLNMYAGDYHIYITYSENYGPIFHAQNKEVAIRYQISMGMDSVYSI